MDSSRHSLFAIVEATYGLTPATPALKTIRHTGASLATAKSTFISEELAADRQISDFRHGTKQTGGDIMGELSYGTYDDFLEAVLCGTWAAKAAPYTAATISAAAADNSINDSANGLPLLTAGDRVTIAGFTGALTTANQAGLVVVTSTAAKMVLSGGVALINDAAGEAVTVTTLTQQLKAGTTRRSFSVMRHFTDGETGSKPWHLFSGQEYNKLQLTVAVNQPIKVSFAAVGQAQAAPSETEFAGSTYVAATTTRVMDSLANANLLEGGSSIAVITEITITLENGIEPRFVLGSASTIKPSIGRSNTTAQITTFFESAALLEKFLNETESALVFYTVDLAGNKYRWILPRIKYNGGNNDTSGQAAITAAYPIQALKDSVYGSAIVVERIPVA